MFTAVWNWAVLAESDRTMKMESHPYFPPESLQPGPFRGSRGWPVSSPPPGRGGGTPLTRPAARRHAETVRRPAHHQAGGRAG
jgi:hypothetical protein